MTNIDLGKWQKEIITLQRETRCLDNIHDSLCEPSLQATLPEESPLKPNGSILVNVPAAKHQESMG